MESKAGCEKFKAIKALVEKQRERTDNIERFSFAKEISEANQGLAEAKYYNNSVWDIYWVDEVEELTPIE